MIMHDALLDLGADCAVDLRSARKSPHTVRTYQQALRAYVRNTGKGEVSALTRRSRRGSPGFRTPARSRADAPLSRTQFPDRAHHARRKRLVGRRGRAAS
jgi:hypothetical protein